MGGGLPEDAFDLSGGEGGKVHAPTDSAAGLALQLVTALLFTGIGEGGTAAVISEIRRGGSVGQSETA